MSEIEYNNLVFEISKSLEELNLHEQLLFLCRGKLAAGSEDSIQGVLSLFKELEQRNHLGPNRLGVMKDLLKRVKEWVLLGKVKKFESKRKEYLDLLEQIIPALDELNDLERLISICRVEIPEANEANIHNVRSLFKELEIHSCLGIDCLDILKEISTQTGQSDLLKEVEQFEEQRNREDEFETRKAQASAFVSSVGNTLIGVLNIKNVFKGCACGIITGFTLKVLSRGSSFDQLMNAVERFVLPAGTSLLQITEGSVCLTVQAENLSALNTLWSLYQDGTLKSRLQTFFVTDELRELAGGEQVEAIVTIEEQEYEKACLQLTRKAQLEDAVSLLEERRFKTNRRSSDSSLYCTVRDSEEAKERALQRERPVTNQAKYWVQKNLAYWQESLKKAEDTRSVTTETSDSGIQGTEGAPSEFGMEEESESSYNLCLKDLSEEVIHEVAFKLEKDPVAKKRFCQSFRLDHEMRVIEALTNIRIFFPDTPVRLLKDVFVALKLYDLVELLEKAPRIFRPAHPMKEIEKLTNARNFPSTFYSKSAVFIIDNTVTEDTAERIGSFFKAVNSQSKVTTITSKPLLEISDVLQKLETTRQRWNLESGDAEREQKRLETFVTWQPFRGDSVWPTLLSGKTSNELALEKLEERKKWNEEEKPKIDKEIKQKQEERNREKEKLQMAISTALDEWIGSEETRKADAKSTLFVVFENGRFHDSDISNMTKRCLVEKLALIPDETKLLIVCRELELMEGVPETLQVVFNTEYHKDAVSLLQILSKRWKTLDLISIMQEFRRALSYERNQYGTGYSYTHVEIKNSLSSIPILTDTI